MGWRQGKVAVTGQGKGGGQRPRYDAQDTRSMERRHQSLPVSLEVNLPGRLLGLFLETLSGQDPHQLVDQFYDDLAFVEIPAAADPHTVGDLVPCGSLICWKIFHKVRVTPEPLDGILSLNGKELGREILQPVVSEQGPRDE